MCGTLFLYGKVKAKSGIAKLSQSLVALRTQIVAIWQKARKSRQEMWMDLLIALTKGRFFSYNSLTRFARNPKGDTYLSGRFSNAKRSRYPSLRTMSKTLFFFRSTRNAAGRFVCSGGFAAFGSLLSMLLLLVGILGTPNPARAQLTIQPAIVLDFSTAPGIDSIYGRKAADALAVELQKSGDYEIVPRQLVEEKVATLPGLAPPYTPATQGRLAQAASASVVFSGRVTTAEVINRRAARVTLEVRKLETLTTDYVNGTTVSESTSELADVSSEVLIDQALNKASATSVLKLKRSLPPSGTVLNTTVNDVELSVGARIGAAVGQRYSVLRDIYNKSKDRVERIKIGEVEITKVEMDQSVARVVGENPAGVRTEDKVRQIFVPASYPVSPDGTASPSSPVSTVGGGGRGKGKSATSKLGGVAALLVLAALFSLGGGSSSDAPTGLIARSSSTTTSPTISLNYSRGAPHLFVPSACITGYYIYRGLSPEAAVISSDPYDFQSGGASQYIDDTTFFTERDVTIDAPATTNATDPCPQANITANSSVPETGVPSSTTSFATDNIDTNFTQEPLQPGVQYFYRVRRVTVNRRQFTTGTTLTTEYELVLSDASSASGGATALVKPTITNAGGNFDTNVFVTLAGVIDVPNTPPINATNPATVRVNRYVDDGIRFKFEFSNLLDFGNSLTAAQRALAVFSVQQAVQQPSANGDLTFNFGNIILPSGIDPAEPVYLRVGVTNPTDQIPQTIFSDRFNFINSAASVFRGNAATKATTTVKKKSGKTASNGIVLPTAPPGRGTVRSRWQNRFVR